jgi:hypothetical protein
VLNCCVGTVCEMKFRTKHLSVQLKKRAVIEFLTAEGVSLIEIH